jgi:ubiquinone/menaquinone biosynthesis C-methylase UbiE
MNRYEVWSRPRVVDDYARESHLQPPEEAILGALIRDLHSMAMLDIGVGGGRTTVHFAKLCRRYVGTDISEGMVAACRARFANWPESVTFQLSDATSMPQFRDGEFDFVMFSFNGIDCIDPEGRLAALKEIARVLKPGGVFVFSTHNTRALPKRLSLKTHVTLHPMGLLRALRFWVQLNYTRNSPAKIKRALAAPFCMVHDGVYAFAYETYYIKPEAQLAQLRPYFQVERVLELSKGLPLDEKALATTDSKWLYYFCRNRA